MPAGSPFHPPMTLDLFRTDAYLRDCEARVLRADADGVVLDPRRGSVRFTPAGEGRYQLTLWLDDPGE